MAIDKFGQAAITQLWRRLSETLDALGEELGVKIELEARSLRYTAESMTFKGEARVVTPEGVKSREQVEFEANAPLFGLTPDDYRKPFEWNGKRWLLIGFNLQAIKYPFSAINQSNGKTFRLPPSALPQEAARCDFRPRVPLFANVPSLPVPPVRDPFQAHVANVDDITLNQVVPRRPERSREEASDLENMRRTAYPHLYNPDGSRKKEAPAGRIGAGTRPLE